MSTMTTVVNGHEIRTRGRDVDASEHMLRSASYTCVPILHPNQAYSRKPSAPITIKGSFSEDDLIASTDHSADVSPPESSGWTTPVEEQRMHADSAQDLVAELHKSPKISVSQYAASSEDDASQISLSDGTSSLDSTKVLPTESSTPLATIAPTAPSAPPARSASLAISAAPELTVPPTLPASSATASPLAAPSVPPVLPTSEPVAPAIANDRLQPSSFAKRLGRKLSYSPSAPSSREPSPSYRISCTGADSDGQDAAPAPPAVGSLQPSRKRTILRKRESSHEAGEPKSSGGLLSRSSTMLRRKSTVKASKQSEPTIRASMEAGKRAPAVPALPKSFSTDRLPYGAQVHHDRPVPMPRDISAEKISSLGALALPRKRDELWNVFRSLDGDYAKFQSKSSALKANVVRASLLPFLRNYADHPSSFTLRSEDLDRRANILNKWWTALLEMLHGKNNQSISGTDRPAILDGISGVMDRPEWRLSPSSLCPLTRRNLGTATPRTKSSVSLASSGADFLTESVHHNVRNMFVQNLNTQMAFVVDRMSLRNASASLVTFCGKATAYAFFFCPGIAEVLVRLWDTPTDTLRRVLDENGIGKFENLGETSTTIVSAFPPAVQQLGFCSLGKTLKHLRTQIVLPLATSNIQWYGFWLERWLGRESDLFYAFVKSFHILVTDYLPTDATKRERICVPGLLLVHAQILVNLDSTIHRDAGPSQGEGAAGLSPIFDDILADPDAVASTLPLPRTNAIRLMAENRLIMLIRDFLSERATEHPRARQLFAESFNDIFQAAARKTSVFDHSSCYTLLDFLEEALVILVRYENMPDSTGPLINSHFWLDVCKRMMDSQNTMTEVRLFSFLFTSWNTITGDAERKADLCLGLLLDEKIFERTFSHWCPMVRAYFMRLICWRVGRYDGESESCPRIRLILETLLRRLRTVWSHHLWLKDHAARRCTLMPSTVPCSPAPGRRLIIMRTDTQLSAGSSFLAFDGIIPHHPSVAANSPNAGWKRHTTLSPVVELDSRPNSAASSDTASEMEPERGLRGFLRSVMGGSKARSKSRGTPPAAPTSNASKRLSVASSPSNMPSPVPAVPTGLARSGTVTSQISRSPASVTQTASSTDGPAPPRHRNCSFKFSLEPNAKHHGPVAMRLVAPRLPMPAQMYVQSQSSEANSPTYMSRPVQPRGESEACAKYAGRALAEWTMVVVECQSFFERRKNEGAPANKYVETPQLAVEVMTKKVV